MTVQHLVPWAQAHGTSGFQTNSRFSNSLASYHDRHLRGHDGTKTHDQNQKNHANHQTNHDQSLATPHQNHDQKNPSLATPQNTSDGFRYRQTIQY